VSLQGAVTGVLAMDLEGRDKRQTLLRTSREGNNTEIKKPKARRLINGTAKDASETTGIQEESEDLELRIQGR
jgi:hypothetical protein